MKNAPAASGPAAAATRSSCRRAISASIAAGAAPFLIVGAMAGGYCTTAISTTLFHPHEQIVLTSQGEQIPHRRYVAAQIGHSDVMAK